MSSDQLLSTPTAPIGIHPGVLCDKTTNPITGWRYTIIGSAPSYDLCQSEFNKLPSEEQKQYKRIAPPVTPRRSLLFFGGVAAIAAARLILPESGGETGPQDANLFYEDFIELPQLSPAEELVGFFFKPSVPATQREASPTARRKALLSTTSDVTRRSRRFALVPAAWADDTVACDEACKQRIADRRALFEQSRTNRNRQDLLDLSRQRAALYNTTFQGGSCIPGIPCI